MNWVDAKDEDLNALRGVCFDIDDTFSSYGKIRPDAFSALWRLREAGFALVPVTGRPAGWCDHIARFWPVDGVVGENGAFVFFMQDGVRKRLDTPMGMDAVEARGKLLQLDQQIQLEFPQALHASDQAYREFDLAIDFCEDVEPWPEKEVDRLVRLCRAEGAKVKISSIHVNAWYGEYDKRLGFEHWLEKGAPGIEMETAPRREDWIFLGDSPNDEPMFEAFDCSVGVANLKPFLGKLKHHPRWLAQEESGAGFAEVADRLVALRGKA